MIGRRGVFRALAGAALGAKAAADEAVARVSGLGMLEGPFFGSDGISPASSSHYGPAPETGPSVWKKLFEIGKLALTLPIPDWRIEELREEAKSVYRLDPDIAALKSFSVSAKITWQRERNLAKRIEVMRKGNLLRAKRDEFERRHGFWFY